MSEIQNASGEPCLSNTGLNSQNLGLEICSDWLDFSYRNVYSHSEALDLLAVIGRLTSEQIELNESRPVFNGRMWSGSGEGNAGTKIWWSKPINQSDTLALDATGNLLTHPDMLPPGHCPVDAAALDAIAAKLPDYVELRHSDTYSAVWDAHTAEYLPHHGWYIDLPDGAVVPAEPGVLKIALSGSVLARVDFDKLLLLLSEREDISCSRLDIALDDYNRQIDLEVVAAAARCYQFFGGKYSEIIDSGERGNKRGLTVYLGSKKSSKRLRAYDKSVESGGVKDCIRLESEHRKKKADELLKLLLSTHKQGMAAVTRVMKSVVLGCFDFRIRTTDDLNKERSPRFPWWTAFLEYVDVKPISISVPVITPTIQRSIDWIKKSVAPTIATLKSVLQEDFPAYFSNLISDGFSRLSAPRMLVAAETDKERLCY